jgi:UDP-N-acetylglucosamine 4,6-dehydratase
MVPEEMAHHSLEFEDHYVITPAIKFFDKTLNYLQNRLGEIGKPVAEKFEYHSGTNPHFLSVKELKTLDKETLY